MPKVYEVSIVGCKDSFIETDLASVITWIQSQADDGITIKTIEMTEEEIEALPIGEP